MDMGPMGKYHMFGRDVPHGRDDEQTAGAGEVAAALVYLLHRAGRARRVERVKSSGGKILNGPMEVPGGDWIVQAWIRRARRSHCTTARPDRAGLARSTEQRDQQRRRTERDGDDAEQEG